MAGTIIADSVEAAATSQMVIKNGISSAPPQFKDGAGTEIGTLCRAWVNFNGTGTVAIRAAFNVSSITDNGVGLYTVNMTTAMPDANYACTVGGTQVAAGTANYGIGFDATTYSTSAVGLRSQSSDGTDLDLDSVSVSVFR